MYGNILRANTECLELIRVFYQTKILLIRYVFWVWESCRYISYLLLLRCGEPGLDEESLLVVSIREALLWSCLPADDKGLFTAPKTLADLGLNRKERRSEWSSEPDVWSTKLVSPHYHLKSSSLPFLVWRMPSSLLGDNFLCCWSSEREKQREQQQLKQSRNTSRRSH